jgi:hypothetical protein
MHKFCYVNAGVGERWQVIENGVKLLTEEIKTGFSKERERTLCE